MMDKIKNLWEEIVYQIEDFGYWLTWKFPYKKRARVLDDYGTLIFKWAEVQITVSEVLKAIQAEPLFGHRVGRLNNTHWMAFMKMP